MYHTSLLWMVILCSLSCKQVGKEATINKTTDTSLALTKVFHKPFDNGSRIHSIALGSCNNQNYPQQIWPQIESKEPQLWIWLGDNIYADTEDLMLFKSMYDQQLSSKNYLDFLSAIPMIGIWDDHDYGENNSGKYFTRKRESKTLMLNFLGVPDTAEVRNREGIYQSYKFGPPEQQVQFIMLDTRYFRDDPDLKNGDYLPSKGDILGEQQWKWLETTLMHSKAKIIFIASGYQIIPTEHRFEKWNNFPKSRQRLFHTIKAADCSKVILLSGDRHAAEISKIRFEDHPYPIYEFTSSGLTHSRSGNSDFEPNTFRMGDQWNEINFGIIQLDWEITPVKILMQIFSKEGNLLEEQSAIF